MPGLKTRNKFVSWKEWTDDPGYRETCCHLTNDRDGWPYHESDVDIYAWRGGPHEVLFELAYSQDPDTEGTAIRTRNPDTALIMALCMRGHEFTLTDEQRETLIKILIDSSCHSWIGKGRRWECRKDLVY